MNSSLHTEEYISFSMYATVQSRAEYSTKPHSARTRTVTLFSQLSANRAS